MRCVAGTTADRPMPPPGRRRSAATQGGPRETARAALQLGAAMRVRASASVDCRRALPGPTRTDEMLAAACAPTSIVSIAMEVDTAARARISRLVSTRPRFRSFRHKRAIARACVVLTSTSLAAAESGPVRCRTHLQVVVLEPQIQEVSRCIAVLASERGVDFRRTQHRICRDLVDRQ